MKKMEKKQKRKISIWDVLMIFIILVVIALIWFSYIQFKNESFACLKEPMVYGLKKLTEVNKVNIICSCPVPQGSTLRITTDGMSYGWFGSGKNYTSSREKVKSVLDLYSLTIENATTNSP